MKNTQQLLCLMLLTSLPLWAHGWPAAVNWSADNEGDTTQKHTVGTYDRCDTPMSNYSDGQGGGAPQQNCHRYNLIWGFSGVLSGLDITLERQIDWNPNVTFDSETDSRLPTIKELIRLFTYNGSQGILDPIIKNWLDNGCRDTTGAVTPCSDVKITLQDRYAELAYNEVKEGYLISSSYRDIDGVNGNEASQIFGIRIKDGKVVVFEAGYKDNSEKNNVFDNYENRRNGMLALCPGLLTNTNGEITGECDYHLTEGDKEVDKRDVANYAVVPVYALLVKTTPLVQ
jgi:hypothetical protein